MSSAPRFAIHAEPNESPDKYQYSNPAQNANLNAGSIQRSAGSSTRVSLLEKQNNGFEYFCHEYGIVPELVNEAFPRRISQFMRFYIYYIIHTYMLYDVEGSLSVQLCSVLLACVNIYVDLFMW